MFQDRKTARILPLVFSSRSHRTATRIADKTVNPRFNQIAHKTWMCTYRNAYDVMAQEAPVLSRRLAVVLCAASFVLGMLLRGAL